MNTDCSSRISTLSFISTVVIGSLPCSLHCTGISCLSISCNNKTPEIQIKIVGIHTPELTSNFLFTCRTSVQPEQENSRDVVTAMLRSLHSAELWYQLHTNNFHKITLKYFLTEEARELTTQLFMSRVSVCSDSSQIIRCWNSSLRKNVMEQWWQKAQCFAAFILAPFLCKVITKLIHAFIKMEEV